MQNMAEIFSSPPYMETKDSALASIKKDIFEFGDISVGSDVEVLWMAKNTQMDGSKKFKFYSANNMFVKNGLFGTDGRTLQGEWRFSPAFDVTVFADIVEETMLLCKTYAALRQRLDDFNIPNIFPYGMGIYPLVEHKGLNLPESIGLHIHLGNDNIANRSKIRLDIVAAFDVFLAPVIKLFEPKSGFHVRTNCGYYGDLSDYEDKSYGMEYKTLPSCLDDKDVFIGCFAVAKALAFEILTNNITTSTIRKFSIKKDRLGDKGYLRVLAKHAELLIKRKCRFYYVYKQEIDLFFEKAFDKDPERFFSTLEDVFSKWNIKCDFTDKPLCKKLSEGQLFLPKEEPVVGYRSLKEVFPREIIQTWYTTQSLR